MKLPGLLNVCRSRYPKLRPEIERYRCCPTAVLNIAEERRRTAYGNGAKVVAVLVGSVSEDCVGPALMQMVKLDVKLHEARANRASGGESIAGTGLRSGSKR